MEQLLQVATAPEPAAPQAGGPEGKLRQRKEAESVTGSGREEPSAPWEVPPAVCAHGSQVEGSYRHPAWKSLSASG